MEASEDKPHESGAYLHDSMLGELDRNGHPISSVDPYFIMSKHPLADILDSDGSEEDLTKNYTGEKGVNRAIQNDDKDLTDELLGYKPKNVGDMDEEIVGSNGAESVVGGQSTVSNTDDDYNKYQEYDKKDFNTLPDNEKEEFFNLWKKYKKNQ